MTQHLSIIHLFILLRTDERTTYRPHGTIDAYSIAASTSKNCV